MHISILDVYDLRSLLKSRCNDPDRLLKEIIAYYLYREYYIETDIYSLSRNALGVYTKLRPMLHRRFQKIATVSTRRRLHVGEVEVTLGDVYIHLFNHFEGEEHENAFSDRRHLTLD